MGVFTKIHRSPTDHRPPTHRKFSTDPATTDDRRPTTDRPSTNPPTHRPVTTDSPKGPPRTQQASSTNPLTHRPTDPPTHRPPATGHRFTDSTDPHQTYFTESTLDQILSLSNFNLSFGLGTIYYCIHKIVPKMTGKKER